MTRGGSWTHRCSRPDRERALILVSAMSQKSKKGVTNGPRESSAMGSISADLTGRT